LPFFSEAFAAILKGAGVESVPLPPRSPNLNAYAERFVRTIKESCLDQMILFGKLSLRQANSEFATDMMRFPSNRESTLEGAANRDSAETLTIRKTPTKHRSTAAPREDELLRSKNA